MENKTKSHPQEDGRMYGSGNHEVNQDDGTKNDPVPAESLEIIAFQITDQELDGDDRNEECGEHARQEYREFKSAEVEAEFDDLQKADPEHDRNAHEEREFCGDEAGSAQNDAPQDGGTGARCSRND